MDFVVSTFLARVDQIGATYVQNAYQQLGQALTSGAGAGVAGLLLTLYVIAWGFGIWAGTARGGPVDHTWRLFRVFAIYALATSWGDFQVLVYTLFNDAPSAIGNAMLGALASANNTGLGVNLTSVNLVQNQLTNVWNSSIALVQSFINNAGLLNFGVYFFAGILLICMAILIAYAVFLIALAKIFMWLLLALGPVFIILLLFGVSSRYFNGWLNSLVNYFLVQVLVYAFLAFYLALTQQYFDASVATTVDFTTRLAHIAPIIIVALIGIFLLMQITNVAAMIAGGAAMQGTLFQALSRGRAAVDGVRWGQARLFGRVTPQERRLAQAGVRRDLAAARYRLSAEYQRMEKRYARRV